MFSLAELYSKVNSSHHCSRISDTHGAFLTPELTVACLDALTGQQTPVAHGDKVIIEVENTVHSIAWMLALWKLGAVVVPVKAGIDHKAIYAIANDCNAKYWLANNYVQLLDSWQPPTNKIVLNTAPRVTGVDLALLIYTSGSTGTPKGIMLSHQNVLVSLKSISQYLRITAEDRILCLSPLSFDYGLYQALFALYNDCHTLLYSQVFNPLAVVKTLAAESITLLPLVPAMASAISRLLAVLKPDLSSLRGITNTGGHLPESVINAWKSYHPELDVYAMYGLTECKRALYLEPEFWLSKPGSVGKPIPGLDAKVLIEQQGQLVEANAGEVGELHVRGTAVMQSYCDSNASGGARLVAGNYRDDNWLATGDLFTTDEDGFFYFKGRNKDLIKQAGFCIYPKDLESLIESCPLVELCAVIAASDANGDEIAVAVIQLNCTDASTEASVKEWISQHIDKDYTPRDIRFADKLALTDNSKIDKKKLEQELFTG